MPKTKIKVKRKSPIKDLVKALKSDPDYRIAWDCNIAMAFIDCHRWHINSTNRKHLNRNDIHRIASQAADHFLKLLCDEYKYPEGR